MKARLSYKNYARQSENHAKRIFIAEIHTGWDGAQKLSLSP